MYKYPGDAITDIVRLLAKLALVFIEQWADKLLDLGAGLIWGFVRLLEEVSGWIN